MKNVPVLFRRGATTPSQVSLILYGAFVLYTVVTWLAGQWLSSQHVPNLRLFGPDDVGLVALGFLGIYLAPRAGFADGFDWRVSNVERWTMPLLLGLGFAVADLAVFKLVLHSEPVTQLTPFMQPFPYSVLLFGSGALYVECLYRFLPIPLLIALVGLMWPKYGRSEWLFWVLALLSSLVEPLEQLITDSPALIAYSFGTGYAMNLLQAVYFRRYGFLAALCIRLGHYALWHVAFGAWVELSVEHTF
ncbi:hypothetical protein [Spirosoma linguale]|uniref:Abortive infection protein n=1 Tax=Spirosoma linguale (strain ATCC 33905 / DSM 74 / LMG 10896 / Claus 1) TaxID=504472 RepID=D2QJ79_SPILD|nr:hypothetical protein Slin_2777 [Spirosoma linguale DSM 74]